MRRLTTFACLATILTLGSACQAADEPVAEGWYDWASPADRPVPPPAARAAFAAGGTYTGARCLCAPGFQGRYAADRKTFVVTQAPAAYSDTLNKTFVATPRQCLNCAD